MGKNHKNIKASEATVGELMSKAGERFITNTRRSIAATDSAHRATFGELDGQDVFVKPFRSKNGIRKATNELQVTQRAAEVGIPTTDALKVIDLRRQRVALFVSKYVSGLSGAHTLSYETDPDTLKGIAVADAAASLMGAVGALHGSKITHGDPQPKNFAFTEAELVEDTFRPIVFDFENGQVHSRNSPVIGQFADNAKQDVQKLAHGLGTRQFGGFDYNVAAEVMRNEVLESYLESPGAELLGSFVTAQIIDRSMSSFAAGRENKSIYNIPLNIKNAA